MSLSFRGRALRWLVLALIALPVGAFALALDLTPADGRWLRAERRDLVVGVEVEGELRAAESAELGPPQISGIWNYKISFLAPEGSEAEVGQPVLGFDTSQLDQQLQQKIAERDEAEKEVEKLATDLEAERRAKELQLEEARARLRKTSLEIGVPESVKARIELEEARIDHRLAKLEIGSLERGLAHLIERSKADLEALRDRRDRAAARVGELEAQIAQMTVTAPRAGTVIYVTRRGGEKKKVGDTVWRADKVVEIPSLEEMIAIGTVDEDDAGRLAIGQPVSLRLDAYPDESYRGAIHLIRRAVQKKSFRNPQKVVTVEIALERTDRTRMRPGMRFRGTIEAQRVEDALVVPEEAVFSRPGGAVVYVHSIFGPRRVAPRFGNRNHEAFEVLEGLVEGTRLLRRSAAEDEDLP